jgi:hypothetical protein
MMETSNLINEFQRDSLDRGHGVFVWKHTDGKLCSIPLPLPETERILDRFREGKIDDHYCKRLEDWKEGLLNQLFKNAEEGDEEAKGLLKKLNDAVVTHNPSLMHNA